MALDDLLVALHEGGASANVSVLLEWPVSGGPPMYRARAFVARRVGRSFFVARGPSEAAALRALADEMEGDGVRLLWRRAG